jgi:hypothetical protein
MTYPKKITIPSDGNKLELLGTDTNPKTKEQSVTYIYTKAVTLTGKEIKWSQLEFEKILRKGIALIEN